MFQMQICIVVVLLLYSGAVSGRLGIVLRQAQLIANIYQQFPHSCIFIITPEAQQHGKEWFFYRLLKLCDFSEQNFVEKYIEKTRFELLHKKNIFGDMLFNFVRLE
jgi:uncharacterized phage-like protein YoqJ